MHTRKPTAASLAAQIAALRAQNAALAAKLAPKAPYVAPNGANAAYNSHATRCITYTSPRIKAALSALPAKPTLTGVGSVAPAGAVPWQYTTPGCAATQYHSVINGENVLLQDTPFTPTYSPSIGVNLFWCLGCRAWVVTARRYVPQPTAPAPGVRPYTARIGGNAFTDTPSKPDAHQFTLDHVGAWGHRVYYSKPT